MALGSFPYPRHQILLMARANCFPHCVKTSTTLRISSMRAKKKAPQHRNESARAHARQSNRNSKKFMITTSTTSIVNKTKGDPTRVVQTIKKSHVKFSVKSRTHTGMKHRLSELLLRIETPFRPCWSVKKTDFIAAEKGIKALLLKAVPGGSKWGWGRDVGCRIT